MKSTETQLEKRGNKYIPNQETMFHGRIGEEIPGWSRLYRGSWFEKQIEAGYTISEETQRVLAEMEEATYKDVPTKPVANMIKGAVILEIEIPPVKPKQKKKATVKEGVSVPLSVPTTVTEPKRKKKAVPGPSTPANTVTPVPVATPVPVITPVPKRKLQTKKTVVLNTPATTPATSPTTTSTPNPVKKRLVKPKPKPTEVAGFVNPETTFEEEPALVKIPVRKTEIDGRSVYLASSKDKVYDLKFNYIGRFNRTENTIDSTYVDSDAE